MSAEEKLHYVALITKTRTQNQGNQALSIAWRDYLAARYPQARVRLFERAPKQLKRYSVRALAAERDPVAAFDRIAKGLLRRMPADPGPDPSVWDVQHDPAQQQVVRFRRLRQALRLRSRVAALNLGAGAYLNRLRHITQADLVVINPAGEFQRDARDTALHYLLETRCAQFAGCRTAFVNLSFEVADPTVVQLSDHVFSSCDVVEFRDEESRAHYAGHDGQREVAVLPDGAILSRIERPERPGGRGLALAINALQVNAHGLAAHWDAFLPELARLGPVTLTSNEWTTDHPFWRRYLEHKGVTCDGQFLDYAAYARFLAGFDVVVSSRLHTCVLGLVAGAAVVPVETGTFKLTGFFNRIGMPDEPLRMGEGDWQARLLDRITSVQGQREARLTFQDAHVAEALAALREGLDGVFRQELLQRGQGRSHQRSAR